MCEPAKIEQRPNGVERITNVGLGNIRIDRETGLAEIVLCSYHPEIQGTDTRYIVRLDYEGTNALRHYLYVEHKLRSEGLGGQLEV